MASESGEHSAGLPARRDECTAYLSHVVQQYDSEDEAQSFADLTWAKSRDSCRRSASESYCCNSNHQRSLAVICPSKAQKLVLAEPAFVMPRFESRDGMFARVALVPGGTAEWLARVDPVC